MSWAPIASRTSRDCRATPTTPHGPSSTSSARAVYTAWWARWKLLRPRCRTPASRGRDPGSTGTPCDRARSASSPVMDGPVPQLRHGQVGALVRVAAGELLVQGDAQPGLVAGVHGPVGEPVGVREGLVGERGVRHVLLDTEVVDREPEVQRRGEADGGDVG